MARMPLKLTPLSPLQRFRRGLLQLTQVHCRAGDDLLRRPPALIFIILAKASELELSGLNGARQKATVEVFLITVVKRPANTNSFSDGTGVLNVLPISISNAVIARGAVWRPAS